MSEVPVIAFVNRVNPQDTVASRFHVRIARIDIAIKMSILSKLFVVIRVRVVSRGIISVALLVRKHTRSHTGRTKEQTPVRTQDGRKLTGEEIRVLSRCCIEGGSS